MAEAVIQITPTTTAATPITRPPLPRYKGKQVDNSDLLEAIDRANLRILEASNLVDSISCQADWAPAPNFFSHRPTRAPTHERLGTSLTVTVTPEGRTVKLKTTSPNGSLPHGLIITTTRAASSPLRQYGLYSHFDRGQDRQHKLKHKLRPNRGSTPRGRGLWLRSTTLPPGFLPLSRFSTTTWRLGLQC